MEWQKNYGELSEADYGVAEHLGQAMRRRIRLVLIVALVVMALHVGFTNPTVRQVIGATVALIKGVSTPIWQWGEGIVTRYGGPDLLLRQRAGRAEERLTQAMAQLATVEAQAVAADHALAADLPALMQNQAMARTYLQALAGMIAQAQVSGPDGSPLTAAAVEVLIAEKVAAYTALQRQLSSLQEAQATYQVTAIEAHRLQAAAQQQLADLETYRALLEVTLPLVHVDTPDQPLSGQGLQALSEELRLLLAQERALHTASQALTQAMAELTLPGATVIGLQDESNTLVADLDKLTDDLAVGQLVE